MPYPSNTLDINGTPLVNDDRNLTNTVGLDFNGAPVGPMGGLDIHGSLNRPLGLQPMAPNIDFGAAQQQIQSVARPIGTANPPQQSRMYYSPSTGEIVVNGFAFNERNASAALASREAAGQPARQFQLPDTATDWRPLSDQEYSSYIDSIVNPGMGRRVSEAWEHAWRGYGDTNLGAILAVDPDNEWATTARANLAREFEENAPFMLQLRDVQHPGQALEYTAQMLTQGIPWLLDTIAWMAAGALIGGATSGGLGAPAGAVEAFAAREGIRRAAAEVLRRNLQRGASAYAAAIERNGGAQLARQAVIDDAVRAGTASADDVNRFFDFSERAFHMQRGTAMGAAGAAFGSNYAHGVGEIRNTIADSGADPTSAEAGANIWGMALPYALIETAGDLIMTQPITRLVPGMAGGPSRIGNALRHGALTAASEGGEEAAQYLVTQQAVANTNNRPIDVDPYDLLENAVAGAIAGGGIGAVAGAIGPTTPRAITLPETPVAAPTEPTAPRSPPVNPYDTGMDIQLPDIPGMSPEVSLGNLPPIVPTPRERTTYPGDIFSDEEQIVPGHASVPRPPGWPNPEPTPAPQPQAPAPIPTAGLLPETSQEETPRNIYDGAINAVIATRSRAGKAIQSINDAIRTNRFVSTAAMQDLPLIAQEAVNGNIPPEHAAIAINLSEPLRQLAIQHNERLMGELEQVYRSAKDMLSWPVEQLKRAQALVASALIDGRGQHTPEARANLAKFQGVLHEAIKQRTQAAPKAQVSTPKTEGISVANEAKTQALLGEAKQAVEDGSVKELSDEKLNQLLQVARRDLKLHKKLKDEVARRREEAKAKRKEEGKKATRAERERDGKRKEEQAKETGKREMGDITYTPSEEVDFEAERKSKEKPNVQERSTETVPAKEQPRASEETPKRDSGERSAPAASANKESNEDVSGRVEEVGGTVVDSARVGKAYEQGAAAYDSMFSFLQSARAILNKNKLKKQELSITTTKDWAKVDNKFLTVYELRALINRLQAQGIRKDNPNAQKKTEPKAEAAKVNKAARFGEDLFDAFKRNKDDPKAFEEFVLDNVQETVEWLGSENAKVRAGIRTMAERILRNNKPDVSLAAIGNEARAERANARQAKLWSYIKSVSEKNELPLDWRDKVIANSDGEFRSNFEIASTLKALLAGNSQASIEARKFFKRDEPQRAGDTGKSNKIVDNPITKQQALAALNGVQKTIHESVKFRTVHVYKDVREFFSRIKQDELIANNGAKITVGKYLLGEVARLKLENPDLKQWSDAQLVTAMVYRNLVGRAVTLNNYKAVMVFSDHIGSEYELMQVLEHEYIVHNGIRAIFKDAEERNIFLRRLRSIPGIEQKRIALLSKYPGYKNVSELEQVEEVIAFHSMEGPLALQKLMSAPEGIDPVTRRTLWEDFKRMVKEWLERVFTIHDQSGNWRSRDDISGRALDAVVSGLREYAVTGATYNLNNVLSNFGAKSEEAIKLDDILDKLNVDDVSRAATITPLTPEETNELLYGGSDNVGRPYAPTNWTDQMIETIRGNAELIEKAKEVAGKGIATPIKEGWKKIGRNLETLINMSQRSTLIEKLMRIMHNTIAVARRIMSKRQETRAYAVKSKLFSKDGSTEEQCNAYNRMAIAATNSKMPTILEEMIREAPRLVVRGLNGMYTINYEVFEALLKRGTFTKEEFEAGIPQYVVNKDGNIIQVQTAKFDKKTIDAGYDMYVAETRHMATSKLETLEHALIMLGAMNDTTVERIIKENAFKGQDQEFVNEMLQNMYKLYADIAFHKADGASRTSRAKQREKARQVLIELMRTFHSKDKVLDWTDMSRKRDDTGKNPRKQDAFKWRDISNDEVAPFAAQIQWFLGNDTATGANRLERLNSLGVSPERQFKMLGAFQSLLNAETQIAEHENSVIQQVLGNYVEMTRNGAWRVFVDVVDAKTGEKLHDTNSDVLAVLPIIYPKTEREAKELQAKLQSELDGTRTILNAKDEEVSVKFDVGYGKAPGTRTLAEAPKIKEFLEVADLVGIKLSVVQMKQIANLIENAAGRKRLGLQRAGTPGMDLDILKNNDLTMTRNAWWAAKMSQAWMIDMVFANKKNIEGDWDRLKELQTAFDAANNAPVRNEQAVYLAEAALLRYANQLRYMSKTTTKRPTVDIRTTKGEQKLKIEPEGQAHLAHAVALRESLERGDLELNLNDLLSKTGPLRMMAVVAQLGTVASGIMNVFTLGTHLPMVLTAKHTQTGYGEGFSFTDTMSEIGKAIKDAGNPVIGLDNSAKVKQLLDEARNGDNKTSLTLDELEFLYKETLEGLLMPQQTYSMTGGTESNITNLAARNTAEALLAPFAAIEAMNRRVSALTTYRLAKARYIKSGVPAEKLNDVNSPEYKQLIEDIERVVYASQGDYANVNRPKAFRGDLAQYVLMYKMFPLMTTLMLYNLPKPQQAAFLGVLFLLGGLHGEPFAEDFMDLYDTLLQKLGFRHDSVELQLTRKLEEIMPGSSGWVMNGFIDNDAFGGTISSRISMGDILPMTGAFREGADLGREIENTFGPAYAANVDALEYAFILADFAMQVAGIKDRTTNWRELIRKFPLAGPRGVGEGALMLADGEITDPRGRLVSDEVTPMAAFSRALGFYPLEATRANNAVRLDRMHIGYMRNIRARYILAYAQAYRMGNQEEMDRVVQMVQDWNDAAREANDDSMLIRNFRSAAVRAGRAASSTTIERTSEGAPTYSLIDELAEIVNADTENEE